MIKIITIKNKLILILVCLSIPFFAQAQNEYGRALGSYISDLLFYTFFPVALICYFAIRFFVKEKDKPLGCLPSLSIGILSFFIALAVVFACV